MAERSHRGFRNQWRGTAGSYTRPDRRLQSLKADAGGTGGTDGVLDLVQHLQNCEEVAAHRSAQILSLSEELENLQASVAKGGCDTVEGIQRPQIQSHDKQNLGHGQIDLPPKKALTIAHYEIDGRAREDGKAETQLVKKGSLDDVVGVPFQPSWREGSAARLCFSKTEVLQCRCGIGITHESSAHKTTARVAGPNSSATGIDIPEEGLIDLWRNKAMSLSMEKDNVMLENAKLSEKLNGMEKTSQEKEMEIKLLSKMDREQKGQIADMEKQKGKLTDENEKYKREMRELQKLGQKRVWGAGYMVETHLASLDEGTGRFAEMENRLRKLTEEKDRAKQENRRLQGAMNDTNDLVAKMGEEVERLKAEVARKDKPVQPLKHQQGLAGMVNGPALDDQVSKVRLWYEQKVAQLNERLAECHGLLKANGLRRDPLAEPSAQLVLSYDPSPSMGPPPSGLSRFTV
ncbi:hypothetical protein NMY22_g14444 [Coprinellus aureogranulatus]|nr:hypothetical protein NMY22_g14444 [Coprinellus aureogranulatus]